jgi:hypothetical protein
MREAAVVYMAAGDVLAFPDREGLLMRLTAVHSSDSDAPAGLDQHCARVATSLLRDFSRLSLVRHVPLLAYLQQWFHSSFANLVAEEEVMELTVLTAIETRLPESEKVRGLQMWDLFVPAWNEMQATFQTYQLDCQGISIPMLTREGAILAQVLTAKDDEAGKGVISWMLRATLMKVDLSCLLINLQGQGFCRT